MKKYGIYSVLIALGFGAGYLIFGTANEVIDRKSPIEGLRQKIHTEKATSATNEKQVWTCAMHPQIMRPEVGNCPICGMSLTTVTPNSDGLAINEIKMTKNAMALADIQTTIVGNTGANEDNQILLSGIVKENMDNVATQPAHFDGRIEHLYIRSVGQTIQKGQKIAAVYSPSLMAAQQELITAYRIKSTQPKLYRAVRNKFKNWKIQDNSLDDIERTGKVISQFPIYSHVSGVVTEINISDGAHITDGMPILKVSDLISVWAEFDVYENQIAQFKKGQTIKIVSNAYPNRAIEAKINFIDPVLNIQTRTTKIRTVLKNVEKLLKPGMFVTGTLEITLPNTSGQINIPASAVLWTGKRSLVYVKTNHKEPIFEMRKIGLGSRNGDTFTVTHGLEKGDEIVTSGTFTVDAAAQLQGKKSMMNDMDEQNTSKNFEIMDIKMNLPNGFQNDFQRTVFLSYLKIKNALVESNALQASISAQLASEELNAILNKDLGDLLTLHVVKSLDLLNAIAQSDDLQVQRNYFVDLNLHIIPITTNLTNLKSQLFIQLCPMANNYDGASWISTAEEIRNPYYGERMMTCGKNLKIIGR